MISALIRKSFTYLCPRNTYFLRESNGSSSLLLHLFSTSRETKAQLVAIPEESQLLLRKTPNKSDQNLLFLKENGFSDAQLEIMIKSRQQLLSANLEKSIKPKFNIFQEMGFSASEIVEIITREPTILCCSANNRVFPSLIALKGLLVSNEKVVKVLRKCGWFLIEDLERRMWPNVEFLKSSGIPMEHILCLVDMYPRCLFLRPEILRERLEKLHKLGVEPTSKMHVYAFGMICSLTNELLELKLQAFRDMGFSEADILMTLKKAPKLFVRSAEKMKSITELILATKKYTICSIVTNPLCLSCSIEKRLEPRLQLLEILDKRSLIKKWPGLGVVYTYSNEKFCERFLNPYLNEIGDVYARNIPVSQINEVGPQAMKGYSLNLFTQRANLSAFRGR